ncbi:MAG TPA: hypothetical protein VFU86_04450 [Terriglobales bacterium]|nr:hypothetical protein [Terriglobales bacterium]
MRVSRQRRLFSASASAKSFVAAGNHDVVEFIRKNHERITSIHLKDRKYDGGPNQVWGQGDTPLE